jgi:SAM-dependent methyltransferase
LTPLGSQLERMRTIAASGVGALRELAQVPLENARHRPTPPVDGLVLDVGGGQDPHPRADVVVDKYVFDDFERSRAAALDFSKPLVVADGHRLPFADGTFVYTIAMHVVEHATDPIRFTAELARVSAGGFVQVPSSESELTFGWPYHPWTIDRDGEVLVFTPKGDRRAPLGSFFHESFEQSTLFQLWWSAHRSRWHHSVEWRGTLNVRVEGDSKAEQTAALDVDRTVAALGVLRERGALQPLPDAVQEALRCPACHALLVRNGEHLSCVDCPHSYPIVGATPVLLEEAVAAST